jgi:hypothetical protein
MASFGVTWLEHEISDFHVPAGKIIRAREFVIGGDVSFRIIISGVPQP